MFTEDAEGLYERVAVGAKVIIEGGVYGGLDHSRRRLSPGDRNSHVAVVQRRLIQLGYLYGNADGVFGRYTRDGVLRARKDLGLPMEDTVDWAFYHAIGLMLFE